MNHADDHLPPESNVDLIELDRLVDGELSDDQRRALVEQLEAAPGGWRRCALAFMEAQSWGQGLRAALQEPAEASTTASIAAAANTLTANSVETPRRSRFGSRLLEQALMLAASFLLAFTLGIAARGWLAPESGPPSIATTSGQVAVGHAPGDRAQAVTGTTLATAGGASSPRQVVLRFAGQQASEDGVPLPVLGADDLTRQWLDAGGQQLPEEFVKQLGRLGHRVETVRDLVPVRLSDGTAAEVPVERLQIRYVGNEYQ